MIVYVLTQGWEYEGEQIVGVFSTKASVDQRLAKEKEDNSAYRADYFVIYEAKLDSPDEPKEMK